jgi:hypothetical protein
MVKEFYWEYGVINVKSIEIVEIWKSFSWLWMNVIVCVLYQENGMSLHDNLSFFFFWHSMIIWVWKVNCWNEFEWVCDNRRLSLEVNLYMDEFIIKHDVVMRIK